MRKSNRKQQQKITRVHGLIGWGQSDLLEQMEREECGLSNALSAQVRKLLAHALVVSLMFLRGDLCSQLYGALCTENNTEVQKKSINWGRDREHGKLILKNRCFLHTKKLNISDAALNVGALDPRGLEFPGPIFLSILSVFSYALLAPVSRSVLLSWTQHSHAGLGIRAPHSPSFPPGPSPPIEDESPLRWVGASALSQQCFFIIQSPVLVRT